MSTASLVVILLSAVIVAVVAAALLFKLKAQRDAGEEKAVLAAIETVFYAFDLDLTDVLTPSQIRQVNSVTLTLIRTLTLPITHR